mgnify:CR=1 FL=1
MKLIKIIAVAAIATTITVQAVQAGSLLGNSDTTGSSLLRSYEETNTNTNNIYDSSGYQMSCYTDSYGNTICE